MKPDYFFTPQTATMILAYIQYYTCKFLPGRCFGGAHLQRLGQWIGHTQIGVRTLRAHPQLAVHIAVLVGADLLTKEGGVWLCTPAAFRWLQAGHSEQIDSLLQALAAPAVWQQLLDTLNLRQTLSIDLTVFVEQTLDRQRAVSPAFGTAAWLPTDNEDGWQLQLPPQLPPAILFDLLQLGRWRPDGVLSLTPMSVATAAQRGYSAPVVSHVLTKATDALLSPEQQEQLHAWMALADAYHVRPVHLLSTKTPQALAEIAANRGLRRHIRQQLSPRDAIVSPALVRPLQQWLRKKGVPLAAPVVPGTATGDDEAGYAWLGLRLLVELGGLVELPFRVPSDAPAAAAAGLDETRAAELEQQVKQLVDGLRAAIRGRDAFFPAEAPVDEGLVAAIEQALIHGGRLEIAYQALGDKWARGREVEPLRLERQGELVYLHAYCYLAEGERVFRLDRVHAWEVVG